MGAAWLFLAQNSSWALAHPWNRGLTPIDFSKNGPFTSFCLFDHPNGLTSPPSSALSQLEGRLSIFGLKLYQEPGPPQDPWANTLRFGLKMARFRRFARLTTPMALTTPSTYPHPLFSQPGATCQFLAQNSIRPTLEIMS